MKDIAGHFEDNRGATVSADRGWDSDLNLFFNRFDNVPLITSPTPQVPPAPLHIFNLTSCVSSPTGQESGWMSSTWYTDPSLTESKQRAL